MCSPALTCPDRSWWASERRKAHTFTSIANVLSASCLLVSAYELVEGGMRKTVMWALEFDGLEAG